jgi:hypothetical protein
MKKFLKILSRIFIVLFVLFVLLLVGVFVFLNNLEIEKYKPQITAIASRELGRDVTFRDIDLDVSFKEGISFKMAGLTVADDPDFSDDVFVKVKNVEAKVDVISYLIQREIFIPAVLIDSPEVTIIRNARNEFNVQTIGAENAEKGSKTPDAQTKGTVTAETVKKAAAIPALFINSARIDNAQITVIDKSSGEDMALSVNDIDVTVKRFSLRKPFTVTLNAAVLSEAKNLNYDGKVRLKLDDNEAVLSDTDLELDLTGLPLAKLRTFPPLAGLPVPQVLNGNINAFIREAVVSGNGPTVLDADLGLENGKALLKDIVPGISIDVRHLEMAVKDLTFDNSKPASIALTAALYQDEKNVELTGGIGFDIKTMTALIKGARLNTDLSLWPLETLKKSLLPLAETPLPANIDGKLLIGINEAAVSPEGLKSLLADLQLTEGSVDLTGLTAASNIKLEKIGLNIRDFTLNKPFMVDLKTAYLSDSPNFDFNGTVAFDLGTSAFAITKGVASVDLDKLPLAELKKSGLFPENIPLPDVLAGKLNIGIDEFAANPKGITKLGLDVDYSGGKLVFKEVAPGINVYADKIDLKLEDLAFDVPFTFNGSLGYESDEKNIFLQGKMKFDPASTTVTLENTMINTDLDKLSLNRLKTNIAQLKDMPLPQTLKGKLNIAIPDLKASPAGLGKFNADIELKEGAIEMKDAVPGISFSASQVNASVNDFNLNEPFEFKLGMAYLNETPNIHMTGTASFDPTEQLIRLQKTKIDTALTGLDLQGLQNSIAPLKDIPLPMGIKGDLAVDIGRLEASAKGLTTLQAHGSLTDWEVRLKELGVPVKGENIDFSVGDNDLVIEPATVYIGKGTVDFQAAVKDYLTVQDFNLNASVKTVDLAEVIVQKDASVKVEGLIAGEFQAAGKAADLESMTGQGNLAVQNAVLKDINILKTVLDKISFIPNVSQRIYAALPEETSARLEDVDTKINTAAAQFKIAGKKIDIQPVAVETDDFIFTGNAVASFDQRVVMNGALKIPAGLSKAMTEGAGELENLFDDKGQISFPVNFEWKIGQMPKISVTQTALDVGKGYLRNQGKKELQKVFENIFGPVDNGGNGTEGTGEGGQKGTGTEPADAIINNILDTIFN